jgi:trans-aconitate methyltransferase
MSFWDQQFAVAGFKYGTAPNVFLTTQAHRLKPASDIVVPGDGEGRNGVWLAQQGHRVTAVDNSPVGLSKALALASERGTTLTTVHADLAQWTPQPDSVDAVILVYLHLPPSLRAVVHRRLLQALRPGGWWMLEAFHPLQLQHSSGGPKDEAMLYTPELLSADVGDCLSVVVSWSGETTLNEGPGHQGLAHVTRWVGQRPA